MTFLKALPSRIADRERMQSRDTKCTVASTSHIIVKNTIVKVLPFIQRLTPSLPLAPYLQTTQLLHPFLCYFKSACVCDLWLGKVDGPKLA